MSTKITLRREAGPRRIRPARLADGVVRASPACGRVLSGAVALAVARAARSCVPVASRAAHAFDRAVAGFRHAAIAQTARAARRRICERLSGRLARVLSNVHRRGRRGACVHRRGVGSGRAACGNSEAANEELDGEIRGVFGGAIRSAGNWRETKCVRMTKSKKSVGTLIGT